MDLHRAVVVVFFESVKAWIDDSFIFTALFSLTIFPKLAHASSTDSDDLLWHCTSCLRSSQPRVDHRASVVENCDVSRRAISDRLTVLCFDASHRVGCRQILSGQIKEVSMPATGNQKTSSGGI